MCSGFVSGKGGVANYCKDDNEASFYATGGGISSLTGRLLVFQGVSCRYTTVGEQMPL